MQSTTNYNLNIVEGTDIVNPLTQLNPNFTDIDTIMKANADASIDHATCIKTGTVHAVTRTNTGANVFRFTATGNWNTGDTMTVDGTLVSVYTTDGTAPANGCFVINSEVLAAIQGTRVTLFVNSSNASNISFDDTSVIYTASNVQDAIENASTATGTEYASGSSVANELNGVAVTGITHNAYVVGSSTVVAFKVGKLVVVNIKEIAITVNVPDADYVILRNLPIPTTNIEFPLTKLSGNGDVSKRLRLNTNGELQNWYSTLSAGETYFGTLVYQTV